MRRRLEISLLLLALIGLLISGNSLAYFKDDLPVAEAKFTASEAKIEFSSDAVIESISRSADCQKVSWSIDNVGNCGVYLRAMPSGLTDVSITEGEIRLNGAGPAWQMGDDGYYYYARALKCGETVEFSLEVNFDLWESVRYLLDLKVEAIQETRDALKDIWPQSPFAR